MSLLLLLKASVTGGTADFSGVGSLTAPTVRPGVNAAISLSGDGGLTTTAQPWVSNTISLSGGGTLTTTGIPGYLGSGSLSGAGGLVAPNIATLAPDGILTQVGISGTLGTITDDPNTPDNSWMVGSGPGQLRVSFPSPGGVLTGQQKIRVRMRQTV